jgi:predicted nuclease with RNAse H fold
MAATRRSAAGEAIVAGVDVGAEKKGCNVVVLRGTHIVANEKGVEPESIPAICAQHAVLMVGVDAPCMWRQGDAARQAERDMARAGVSSFSTPTEARGRESAFFGWMFFGMRVYQSLQATHPRLQTAHHAMGPACFETFPHAITCALLGTDVARAGLKGTQRKALLESLGIDTGNLTSVDARDAALCAVTAQFLLRGKTRTYGDVSGGFIHVPDTKRVIL